MTNLWVWAWNPNLGALMFKDTCTVGKVPRSNHGIWAPLSPASWEARVTNDLWKKRTFVYTGKSLKKKNWGKFVFPGWVQFFGSDGMVHFIRFYYQAGTGPLTHSMKLLTHSRPKIEFYLFSISNLPTLFPPTQLIFFFFFWPSEICYIRKPMTSRYFRQHWISPRITTET